MSRLIFTLVAASCRSGDWREWEKPRMERREEVQVLPSGVRYYRVLRPSTPVSPALSMNRGREMEGRGNIRRAQGTILAASQYSVTLRGLIVGFRVARILVCVSVLPRLRVDP